MRLLFTLISIFIPAVASAADWTPVSMGSNGNILLIDASSLIHEGDIAKAWIKVMRSEKDEYRKLTRVAFSVEMMEFNCREHLWKINHVIEYDANGKVTFSRSMGGNFSVVTPDSIGEEEMRQVCNFQSPASVPIQPGSNNAPNH